jgi:RHS repeat-associated protein
MRVIPAMPTHARSRGRSEGITMIVSMKAAARMLLFMLSMLALFFATGAQAQNNAAFVSQTVPTSMVTGATYNVTIVLSNTGSTTWTSAGNYLLGGQNPENTFTWRYPRVDVPAPIAPGGQASFSFQVTAPTSPGTYNFQWRMVQEYVEWFGTYTPNVAVTVSAPVNGSQVISTSVPAAMTQGQSYPVAVTMKNTGGTTWPAGATYRLGSANPLNNMTWGVGRVNLNNAVLPGQQYTFSFNVVAPTAGSYSMGWQMLQEDVAWFGPASNSPVTVTAPAQAPTMSVTRTPTPMTAGQGYTLNWSSTNATSVSRVCTSTGTGYTVNDAPALSGTASGTASVAWVGAPSSCVWRATGAGGAVNFNETMTTNAAPSVEVVTYIHTDGLGSPVARTSSTGALVSRTRYEPYGLTAGGATPTIGFTGHVNDADTGLVYMQQRYYDPVAGRFLSIDPVTTDANTGSSFNRYAYANNSPYRYIDPDGRNTVEDFLPKGAPIVALGNSIAAIVVIAEGVMTGNASMVTTGKAALQENKAANIEGLGAVLSMGRGGRGGSTKIIDPVIGQVGRISVSTKGNAMLEPVGGNTVPAGKGGVDTHTVYPNGSNAQRLNEQGHPNNPTPHGHGHQPGTGPAMKGQGPSTDPQGNVVKPNSPEAHWPIN